MFADSKNPLAADLIKEFKAISINKTTSQNHNPKTPKSLSASESKESPSNVLLSRLRSKENDKIKEEISLASDKQDIFKRYSVDMIDLNPGTSHGTTTPLAKKKITKSSHQRVSKKLDQILALKAKSKPVPLPATLTSKGQDTKSIHGFPAAENSNDQGELVIQRSVSLDSWDSDENYLELEEEGGYGSFYEEPNNPTLVSGNISPTSLVSQRRYYPVPFQFERGNSDSGKTKPPIPTPRPKDEPYEGESMSHLSHRSQNGDINVDHDRESRRNPGLSENIYESLDFRESIDIDSEDDNLPDILKHTNSTKSRNKNTTDEIYESLDHYQAEEDYDGYLALASLEPPTPSRLNPQFRFSRSEPISKNSSKTLAQQEVAIPVGQTNSKNTYIRENVCIQPSSTSMIQMSSSPHLGNMKLSHRRETIGTLFVGDTRKKGHDHRLSSLPCKIEEDSDASKLIKKFPWFRDISRKRAEQLIREVGSDGTFLVRRSKNGGIYSPFTLTLLYQQNMFHINIRAFCNGKYALGKSKSKEMIFDSVEEIIKRHRYEPLMLVGLDGQAVGNTILSRFPLQ